MDKLKNSGKAQSVKITTQSFGDGFYSAHINGIPLIGKSGCISRFSSRRIARKSAEQRIENFNMKENKIE